MERLRYRSTSLVDLQAEMRQREFLSEADRPRLPRRTSRRRTFLGLPIPGRRPRD
ncbi:MAG TPA: hypothetical protein VMP86_06435 [Candidatus Binatia bacterium]|nr:hypothetical protein [Candidatus Binatia bacterium]